MRFYIYLLTLFSKLPIKFQYFIGNYIGHILRLFKVRYKVVRANINYCYPSLAQADKARLIKDHYCSLGKSIIELGLVWFQPYEKYKCKVNLVNFQNFQNAKNSQKKVLLLGHHTTHSELILIHLSKIIDTAVLYRPNDNKELDHIIQTARTRHLKCISKFSLKQMIRWLKNGNNLFITPDQDPGSTNAPFIPFFNNPTATLNSPIKIATSCKAALVPIAYHKLSDEEVEIEFLPNVVLTGDEITDLTSLNSILERSINKAPAQYYWVHRRFKTLPKGVKSIY